ncbi:RNA-directed DNA polymerase, eukaryota, partial [Tanacetum coccineum]
MIDSWDGECVLLGDFNEVRSYHERYGTIFNLHGANAFNNFITMTGLVDLPLQGYSYTWSHKTASKMSKLDRFLISEGLLTTFPSLSALCLDRNLSDHRPILMRELNVDYGPTSFWYHFLKQWIKEERLRSSSAKVNIQNRLSVLDKSNDQGRSNDGLVNERSNLLKELHDLNSCASLDMFQKAKIRWPIEGDENSKYFHGVINKKRSQMAIRRVLVDGDWIVEPSNVKKEFLDHFSNIFTEHFLPRLTLESQFPNSLSSDQQSDLERDVSYDQIKKAVWDCGINKSPGPD